MSFVDDSDNNDDSNSNGDDPDIKTNPSAKQKYESTERAKFLTV